jgi:holin-like protein
MIRGIVGIRKKRKEKGDAGLGGRKPPCWFVIVEIFFLFLLYQLGDALVRFLRMPVPPALIGMALLLVLLATGKVQVQWLERSSRLFTRHLILLLLPVIVGVIRFVPALEKEGWKLAFILVVSTATVLVSTVGMARLMKKGRDE